MEDKKHTPLPFFIKEHFAGDKHLYIQGAPQGGKGFVANVLAVSDLANAEFIVRACNSHYELLDIIKRCQDGLTTYIVPNSGITDFDVVNQLLRILDGRSELAAIAKAEGK